MIMVHKYVVMQTKKLSKSTYYNQLGWKGHEDHKINNLLKKTVTFNSLHTFNLIELSVLLKATKLHCYLLTDN